MHSRRAIILSMLCAGTLAFNPTRPVQAQDGCTELEECLPEVERVFEEEMNGDALVSLLLEAATEADPADEGESALDEGESFDDAPKLRKGQAGDVVKAIVADPTVKKHVYSFKDKAVEQIKSDWEKLKTGEKVATLSFMAPVAAGVVTGVLKSSSLHKPAQDVINAAINHALGQKAPWFALSVDIVSPNKVMLLKVDVMYLLRKAGVGF
ncbi:hypothetical protein [Paraliomyxa miuraensis]|uniref:hypothetical protein n=1 Tax=Paraliomyxa miuraensis TaxID=376150 RepID=UPI002258DC93|nr:hypothetical protein [Paraliomyxa miuraensis]MCX4247793.1 hypothetical protein [Paraliomyxa miuraensis]